MSEHIKEEYDGIISGVASFGFFVTLANTIEGLVRVDSLQDDYYILERDKYRFVGQNYHKVFGLGQKVRIKVESVDLENREVNFVLILNGSDSRKQE